MTTKFREYYRFERLRRRALTLVLSFHDCIRTLQRKNARPVFRPDYSLLFDHTSCFAAWSWQEAGNKIDFRGDACFL